MVLRPAAPHGAGLTLPAPKVALVLQPLDGCVDRPRRIVLAGLKPAPPAHGNDPRYAAASSAGSPGRRAPRIPKPADIAATTRVTLETRLYDREAFRAIFSFGGSVAGLADKGVSKSWKTQRADKVLTHKAHRPSSANAEQLVASQLGAGRVPLACPAAVEDGTEYERRRSDSLHRPCGSAAHPVRGAA